MMPLLCDRLFGRVKGEVQCVEDPTNRSIGIIRCAWRGLLLFGGALRV